MAVTMTSAVQVESSVLGPKTSVVVSEEPQTRRVEPKTINELMLQRAATIPHTALIAYPDEAGNWVEYTAQDLDNFADEAAKELTRLGLTPKVSQPLKGQITMKPH